MPLVITLSTKRKRCAGGRCPYIASLSFGGSRRSDIMGIGQKNAIDIPACEEMQGMNGSSVVGLGGQHTEPVKTVYEFADGLAVTVQVFG